MSVEVLTFGCRINAAESDVIRALATRAGHRDLVVLNSCAVTAEAARDAERTVRRIARTRPGTRVVATGCAAQIDPARFAAMPELDAVIGNAEKTEAATWASLFTPGAQRIRVGDIMTARAVDAAGVPGGERDRTRAVLAVQNGCDHRCTFCVIPFGRGNSRSVPLDAVIAQARQLAGAGAREIVLTGVDLTSYGADLSGRPRLGDLVRAILAGLPTLDRLRVSSIDSVEVDDAFLDAMATEPRLMPHLHLSLQAGDDMILKRMKRRHGRADAIRFCERVRALRPETTFGADLIAGFPTETEAMFAGTLDLVEACGLTFLHVFPYSPRPGTPASRMPAVAPPVVRERAARLRAAGTAALARHLDAEVGRRRVLLTEKGGVGRTEGFTPVRLDPATPAGRIVEVAITGHDGQRLLADTEPS